jgi:hypothetical protein
MSNGVTRLALAQEQKDGASPEKVSKAVADKEKSIGVTK